MSVTWKPNGTLDVTTEATDLPQTADGSMVESTALARCINMSLETVGAISTRRGSSRLNDGTLGGTIWLIVEQSGDRYSFAGTEIYQNGVSIASGLTERQWSGIRYNQYNDTDRQVFALNGVDRKRINGTTVAEWGIDAPSAAPTVGVGSGTGLTGTYKARYTYLRKVGSTVVSESNPSPASSGQALSNEDLSVTWAASSDSQVTHVRIYRTLANGGTYYVDQDIAIGTVTVDTDTADTALGVEVQTDHNRPPLGTVAAGPFYGGICFIAKGNELYWCKSQQPEYWPTASYIEVGHPQQPITDIVEIRGQVYALSRSRIWFIQGTTGGAFRPVPIGSLTGAPNQFASIAVEGRGLYHVGHDGIYVLSGGRDSKVSQIPFQTPFDGTAARGVPAITQSDIESAWLLQFGNRVWFHWGAGSVLVFNLDTQRTTFYQYDEALRAPVVDHTNDRILVGDSSRFIRELETGTTDPSGDISWEAGTPDFTLQTRRHFPRWVKYDTAGTVTGYLYLDDVLHQTHANCGGRNTRRRLVDTGNGRRCSIRLKGTGSATVYATEFE